MPDTCTPCFCPCCQLACASRARWHHEPIVQSNTATACPGLQPLCSATPQGGAAGTTSPCWAGLLLSNNSGHNSEYVPANSVLLVAFAIHQQHPVQKQCVTSNRYARVVYFMVQLDNCQHMPWRAERCASRSGLLLLHVCSMCDRWSHNLSSAHSLSIR